MDKNAVRPQRGHACVFLGGYVLFGGPPKSATCQRSVRRVFASTAAMAWVSDNKKSFSLKHSPSLSLNNLTSNVSAFVSTASFSTHWSMSIGSAMVTAISSVDRYIPACVPVLLCRVYEIVGEQRSPVALPLLVWVMAKIVVLLGQSLVTFPAEEDADQSVIVGQRRMRNEECLTNVQSTRQTTGCCTLLRLVLSPNGRPILIRAT